MKSDDTRTASGYVGVWFDRDFRLSNHDALACAAARGPVVALVSRPREQRSAVEKEFAEASQSLSDALSGAVHYVESAKDIARIACSLKVHAVYTAHPVNAVRAAVHTRVIEALAQHGIDLIYRGSLFACTPGLLNPPLAQAWESFAQYADHWERHVTSQANFSSGSPAVQWAHPNGTLVRTQAGHVTTRESAARRQWEAFCASGLHDYGSVAAHTSGLSCALSTGAIHPGALLADLGPSTQWTSGQRSFVHALARREFYADIAWRFPASLKQPLRQATMRIRTDPAEELVAAWQQGRTGYPYIDAAQRQLLADGVAPHAGRAAAASFLVKDLHVDWRVGMTWHEEHAADFDAATCAGAWQTIAGATLDATPFAHIVDPVAAGRAADPHGDYIRAHVPELRHIPSARVHTPWDVRGGHDHGYPKRCVLHSVERVEALRRFSEAGSPR